MIQTGLLDWQIRFRQLDAGGDPLPKLKKLVDWECFRLWKPNGTKSVNPMPKGCKHKEWTEWEKKGNRTRSRIRSRVEHVFGVQTKRAGDLIIRTIGLIRAEAKIGLKNLAYNLDRLCVLQGV